MTTLQRAAELQVLLEGVPLPATKQQLVRYAHEENEHAARELEALPDREYRTIDEVGEELASVQPDRSQPSAELPRDESGKPPGGDDYTNPHPTPGAVRLSAPPSNPPQKAIEQQTKTQQEQQERRKHLGSG